MEMDFNCDTKAFCGAITGAGVAIGCFNNAAWVAETADPAAFNEWLAGWFSRHGSPSGAEMWDLPGDTKRAGLAWPTNVAIMHAGYGLVSGSGQAVGAKIHLQHYPDKGRQFSTARLGDGPARLKI